MSFTLSILIFTAGHKFWEWPAAFGVGIIYTLLLYRRKEIFDCMVAHAVTNLCLGVYVLAEGKWGYW
jgi:membrane protease YdiL (CAAX protease family)